ncbi:tetratricopeptide repeat protein [Flavitalea sp. BT771]|uniref:tetratricopeptide repeat protein n=1 Tax=Flavitalea sp. BT771 TaxID=3063329 RepID=UPI0026E339DD|nr:tetratricopeptide repeat protein [Flavitalea sp. BT771]MDO6431852.1 tetratricopeptide repeat protein [Flavitalea sp. BT771]MDV6220761.1 tetratricopeptide repeat protein [Flavitalea sp. BT771]
MRKCLACGLLLLIVYVTTAQKDFLADSLRKDLSISHTDASKANALAALAAYYGGVDEKLSKSYGDQAMEVAELSRDRKLIATTWLKAGFRLLNKPGVANNMAIAMDCFQQAEKVARDSDLEDELGFAYVGMARVARGSGDYGQALNYNNLALSVASTSGNDSLKVTAYNSMGYTYRYRNEKLLAFRHHLDALNVAELSGRDPLLALAYHALADFYVAIEEYDKAIDYEMKVMAIDRKAGNKYALLDDYNNTGKIFVRKKQSDLALSLYEKSIALADSLHYISYKLNPYLDIANMYFNNDETLKGMAYLNDHPEIKDWFIRTGIGFFLDEGYGSIYSLLGKYDSAYYYFKRAEPEIEQKANPFGKYDFYRQFGDFYKSKGDYKTAITYYLKSKAIGEDVKDIYLLETTAKNLDTLYGKAGDFRTAYSYNVAYNQYKDSLRNLAKEADLLKLEVDNDNKRHERLAREEEERVHRRHNIQYMGFTAGIVTLFIVLVMLGFFMVSPRTIRALGFFSFIFLFEFIILLADKQIHEWTHGEPWKILLIKIFLAAGLLPLHHWLEHKVIHYLNTRRKFVPGKALFKLKKEVPSTAVE